MRKYYLASPMARAEVDLREFQAEIREAVSQIMPQSQVVVEASYYTVSPTPERGDAIRIGRLLSSKDVLGRYCIQAPKLFCSEKIESREACMDGRKETRHGGHH